MRRSGQPAPAGGRASGGNGLQAERTFLSWQRTGLSFLGLGALLVHVGGGLAGGWRLGAGILGLATAAAMMLHAYLRYRDALAAVPRRRPVAAPRSLQAITLATCALGVATVALQAAGRP